MCPGRALGWRLRLSARALVVSSAGGHREHSASTPGSSEVAAGLFVFVSFGPEFAQLRMHTVMFSP